MSTTPSDRESPIDAQDRFVAELKERQRVEGTAEQYAERMQREHGTAEDYVTSVQEKEGTLDDYLVALPRHNDW